MEPSSACIWGKQAEYVRQVEYEEMAAAEIERLRPEGVDPERWDRTVRDCEAHLNHTLISAAKLMRTVYDAYGEKGLYR